MRADRATMCPLPWLLALSVLWGESSTLLKERMRAKIVKEDQKKRKFEVV